VKNTNFSASAPVRRLLCSRSKRRENSYKPLLLRNYTSRAGGRTSRIPRSGWGLPYAQRPQIF